MKGSVVPSSKPKIEGILPEDLHQRIEEFLLDRGISRSKLVQLALEQYIDEKQVHIPLDASDRQKLSNLAEKHCRTFELEAQYAIQKFILDNEPGNERRS